MYGAGLVISIGATLIALKVLLVPSYVSTDFEVHRNWLAITKNKPLNEWYTENTSEWTLDYPPFFAYFELFLANIAKIIGLNEILVISATPVFNWNILAFQRFTVIATDVFYMIVCALYSFKSPKLVENIPNKLKSRVQECCFILLACLQALIMIDSIHFQYNSLLTAIFILSIYFIDTGKLCLAGFTFAVLLNFKHIYAYYALGYMFYYLANYFNSRSVAIIFNKSLHLAFALVIPFVLSLGPLFVFGGFQSIIDLAHRLFPVSRGLTHAFWAPNFWALYNFVDLVLYRVLKLLKIGQFEAPTYTSGLVQEYSHSVLPNVSPVGTLILVVLSSIVVLVGLLIRIGRSKKDEPVDFTLFAIFSSLCFFFFGYHVHEKAIILITVPMTIFTMRDPKYFRHLIFISTVASFSLFPLLFTPFEVMSKYGIAATYFFLQLQIAIEITGVSLTTILPIRYMITFGVLLVAEFYNTFLHSWLLEGRFPFAPLMCISVLTAVCVLYFFISLSFCTLAGGSLQVAWCKAKCRIREQLIRDGTYSVQNVDDEEDVELVAGVDISASKRNSDMVVVSMSIYSYPDNTPIKTISSIRLLEMPYIPQYLAVREAEVVADFVRQVVEDHPELRPDVILCDGFGKYHSRDCGMACHVGALTGIPTIGVAKNLAFHGAYKELKQEVIDSCLDNARKTLTQNKNKIGWVPFDVVEPVELNIVRLNSSMSGVFVSAGYGIELDVATTIAVRLMKHNTTCEPIRDADLKSRDLVRHYFD